MAVVSLVMSLAVVAPAAAVIEAQDVVVSDNPVGWTPHVLDGEAEVLAQIGSRIYVAGDFQQVQDAAVNGGTVYDQPYLFAFDRDTGAIDPGFRPTLNRLVRGISPSADGQLLYVVGAFTSVNGTTRYRAAAVDAVTGDVDPVFHPGANGWVNDVVQRNGRVFMGGNFSVLNGAPQPQLAEVDPVTGDTLGTLSHTFGSPDGGGIVNVGAMDVSPDGSRLVAVGNFGTVDGQSRQQIVQFDVSTTPSTLFDWQTTRYSQANCFSVFDTYMRDVEFSPDGSYFVVATTGGGQVGTLCDSVARWETAATGAGQLETWANSTGGDTLYSAASTGDVVYVGGHQRWMNNPFGRDFAGPGAVVREGIAAVDARNGVPFSWNPGRTRGVGLFDFLSGPEGLYAVSDTDRWGNFEYHGRLALFPTQGGSQLPEEVPGEIPGTLMQLAPELGVTNPGYLYRVNAGGPLLGGTDGGIDWAADTGATSPYRNSGSNASGWTAIPTVDTSVPPTTPPDIYSTERWDPADGDELMWEFPVAAGTDVQVRLYFANRCTCTDEIGQRVFDVAIDGATVLDDLDLVAVHGDDVGTMYAFDITSDGLVDIDLGHVVENPLINGIEIVDPALLDDATATDDVRLTEFDGESTGVTTSVAGDSFAGMRGAFMISGELFTALANGTMTRQTFDGATFSPPELLDLNGLTSNEFPVSSLTGLSYDPITGRILYTVQGDSNLYHRGFLPESGIVSAQNIVAQSSLPGVDWSQVRGLHLSPFDGHLYYGTVDGDLRRVDYAAGTASGTPVTLSGPGVDGLSWSRGLTAYAGADIAPPNQVPTAAITATCIAGECSLSALGSDDPDGEIVSYDWDFGDGATASGELVDHSFAEGDWTVTLTVTDDDGASGQTTESVSFGAEPNALVDASCLGLACTFDGSGSEDFGEPVVAWEWDFGDGATSSGEVVDHQYAQPGTYTVELTVTDDEGDTASTTTDVTVDELDESISWVGSDSDVGQSTSFDVAVPGDVEAGDLLMLFVSSSRPGIGDATPTGVDGWSNEDVVTSGNATVAVWSQVADGSEAGQIVSVDMEGLWTKADVTVAAWRGVDPASPLLVSTGVAEDVTRADHTTPSAQVDGDGAWVVSYWTDRTSSTTDWTPPPAVTVRHEGHTTGGGRASALMADSGGPVATGTVGGLTATADSSTSQATMWTFALAPSSFEPLPEEPPVADAGVTCVDLVCTFDASGSSGVDDAIAAWEWDFGDGTGGSGEVVEHAYSAEGSYSADLVVTDTQGLQDTTVVEVTDLAVDPVASFTVSCVDLTCSFDGSASNDVGDPVVSYAWDLGDGEADTGATVEHVYADEGSYTVELTVVDDEGDSTATSEVVDVEIGATPEPPVAAITSSCTDLSCSFDGSGSTGTDDAIVSWDWDFGDGSTGSGETVDHEYGDASTFTVELTVTDTQGLTDTESVQVTTTLPPPGDAISWVGSDSLASQLPSFSVTVPGDVQAGDLLMLFVSSSRPGIGDATPTGVDGWSNEDTITNNNATVAVWSQVADGSEAGETVSIDMEGLWTKADVTVAAWRGVDPASPLLVAEGVAETENRSDHTTPAVENPAGDSWVVSYWTDRNSATTAWTAPPSVTVRHEGTTTGGGRASALLADSGGPAASGQVGGLTATADSAAYQATMWTFVIGADE